MQKNIFFFIFNYKKVNFIFIAIYFEGGGGGQIRVKGMCCTATQSGQKLIYFEQYYYYYYYYYYHYYYRPNYYLFFKEVKKGLFHLLLNVRTLAANAGTTNLISTEDGDNYNLIVLSYYSGL